MALPIIHKLILPNDIESIITTETPKDFTLFTMKDLEILKEELRDLDGNYKELYFDQSTGSEMFTKTSGEGSGNFDPSMEEQYYNLNAARSKFIRYKYSCLFHYPTQLFYDVMRDYRYRFEWDARDIGRRIVQIYHDKNNEISYQVVEHMLKKGALMLSNRDVVVLTAEYWEGDTLYILIKSIEDHPLVDAPDSSTVRSQVLYCGICIQPEMDGKSTRYITVAQIDPKGWIPSSFINWAIQYIPKEFREDMIKGMEQRLKKDKDDLVYINYFQPYGKRIGQPSQSHESKEVSGTELV